MRQQHPSRIQRAAPQHVYVQCMMLSQRGDHTGGTTHPRATPLTGTYAALQLPAVSCQLLLLHCCFRYVAAAVCALLVMILSATCWLLLLFMLLRCCHCHCLCHCRCCWVFAAALHMGDVQLLNALTTRQWLLPDPAVDTDAVDGHYC